MDAMQAARREAALEIDALAAEFERSDEAAFRRGRLVAWALTAALTILAIVLLLASADQRYVGIGWVLLVVAVWAAYAVSRHRQKAQTGKLRALAVRLLAGGVAPGRQP